jgi:hypothetical protein
MQYGMISREESPNLPKFIHYAGHMETLAKFFDGLGVHRLEKSPPGSALFFEFFRENGNNYVRSFF